jgi:uncharacterized protein (DUF2141 family)
MRIAGLLIAGALLGAPAHAQSGPAKTPFLPIPDMTPPYLFEPHPLAGTMLKPFEGAPPHTPPEVSPEPGPVPATTASVEPSGAAAPAAPAPQPAEAPAAAEPVPEPPEEPPAAARPPPAKAKAGVVTVIVENVESAKGTVNVALCNTGLSQQGCPYSKEVAASAGFVETEFDDIPPGQYAVVGYHDVNGNSEFDKLFGMPREPYALSGPAANKLVPTFTDAVLPINAGPNAVVIRLKRLGG